MDKKVYKVILFQFVLLFFANVVKEKSTHGDLKRVTVVDVDNEKDDSNGAKESSDVGKDFV